MSDVETPTRAEMHVYEWPFGFYLGWQRAITGTWEVKGKTRRLLIERVAHGNMRAIHVIIFAWSLYLGWEDGKRS